MIETIGQWLFHVVWVAVFFWLVGRILHDAKRDYFAANALQGMFAADTADSVIRTERKVKLAYEVADAMLEARKK